MFNPNLDPIRAEQRMDEISNGTKAVRSGEYNGSLDGIQTKTGLIGRIWQRLTRAKVR